MTSEPNKQLIDLLDSIQVQYPKLGHDQRVYLASIARGYKVMLKYGGTGGTPDQLTDEWICGNDTYCSACNAIQELVGFKAEAEITEKIRKVVSTQ